MRRDGCFDLLFPLLTVTEDFLLTEDEGREQVKYLRDLKTLRQYVHGLVLFPRETIPK